MLEHKIAVYVPSTYNWKQRASNKLIAQWEGEAKRTMAQLFGGFTAVMGQGGYLLPDGQLVEEAVRIIRSHTDASGLNKVNEVFDLARRIAVGMQQQSVAVVVDNAMHFVPAVEVNQAAA